MLNRMRTAWLLPAVFLLAGACSGGQQEAAQTGTSAVEVTDRSVSLRNAYSVEPRERFMQAPPQPAAQNLAGGILESRYIVERPMIQLSQDRLYDCVDMGII